MTDGVDSREQFRRTMDVVRIAAPRIYRSQLPRMAAALAYRTLFSIIPLLVVGLVVIGAFAEDEQVEQAVRQVLDFTGIDQITVGDPAAEGGEPAAEPDPSAEAAQPGGVDQPMSADQWIASLVKRVRTIPYKTLGFMGVLFLVYAAMSLFMEVERAFNQIYHARASSDWFMKILTYWGVATLGIVLLVATFFVGQSVVAIIGEFAGGMGAIGSVLVTAFGFCVTVCISALLLVSLYKLVPNTDVSFRSALAGALLAAVLWEAGKWGFTQYVRYSAGYSRIYGSVALIPLFMMWVYVTWLIVLFGLQVACTLQYWREWEEKPAAGDDDGPAVVDASAIVLVATEAATAFARGEPIDAARLAERTGLSDAAIRPMLEQLTRAGVVHRVEGRDGPGRIALARPAERVRVADLVELGHRLGATSSGTNGARVLAELREAEMGAAGARTLADLVPDGPGPGVPPSGEPEPG